jgi:hypothetical protein
MTIKYKKLKQRRRHPSLQSLAEQLTEERDARGHFLATIADLRRQLAREIRTNVEAARTVTELRFAIRELFQHFEHHTNGYTTAEMNRLDEIRRLFPPAAPKPVVGVVIEQQQPFQVIVDPTQTAAPTPPVAVPPETTSVPDPKHRSRGWQPV